MKQKLDIETWKRKAHFRFFSTFEEPFYGICAAIDCTEAYSVAKSQGISVFLYCLHRSLLAIHRSEPFKYRIENDEVLIYERIDAAITVARDNGTFGYGHIAYSENLQEFLEAANCEVERVRGLTDLVPSGVNNTILYSALPWIDFTSLSHARKGSFADSRPRISFGKMTENSGKRSMPVSIHVHHALVDGLDVGQYLECFQGVMNQH